MGYSERNWDFSPIGWWSRYSVAGGTAAGAQKIGAERAAIAYQQGRRPVPAHAAGAGSTTHSGAIRRGLRSQALGAEVSGTRRTQREEASHRGHVEKAGGVTASPVGERRSVRTTAQQLSSCSCSSRVKTKSKSSRKRQKPSRVPVTALIAWPSFRSCDGIEVANQMAAPAEPRTPNVHRAKPIALRECGWKHGDRA